MKKNMYGLYDIETLVEGQLAYLYKDPTLRYLGLYKHITGREIKWFFTSERFLPFPDDTFVTFPKFIGWSMYDVPNSLLKHNNILYLKDFHID